MDEQLGKIKSLSQEYKQGIDMFKEHVSPEKQPSDYESVLSSLNTGIKYTPDPSYFDKNLNKEIFTSKRGGHYYITSHGIKKTSFTRSRRKIRKK